MRIGRIDYRPHGIDPYGNDKVPTALGIWMAFNTDAPLPFTPVIPPVPVEPPAVVKMNTLTFNENVEAPGKENVPEYTPKHLDPLNPLPGLVKVQEPNVNIEPSPNEPVKPEPIIKLKLNESIPAPILIEGEVPVPPSTLPHIPNIPEIPGVPGESNPPETPKKQRRRIPKTSDASQIESTTLFGIMGAVLASMGIKKNKDK